MTTYATVIDNIARAFYEIDGSSWDDMPEDMQKRMRSQVEYCLAGSQSASTMLLRHANDEMGQGGISGCQATIGSGHRAFGSVGGSKRSR